MSLLDTCPVEERSAVVLKLAAPLKETARQTLLARGLHPESVGDTERVVAGVGTPLTAEDVVDNAFRPKPRWPTPFSAGRFGDGSISVYYSALERVTCEREIAYHQQDEFSEVASGTLPYLRFSLIDCRYAGTTAELRGKEADSPDLISETEEGYPFCQSLGLDARARGIAGFYTASARNRGGTCVPIFTRDALSQPHLRYTVRVVAEGADIAFHRES